MPLSEYTDSVGGGLKLKGVKDARVKKHKKKKSSKDTQKESAEKEPEDRLDNPDAPDENEHTTEAGNGKGKKRTEDQTSNRYGKTEAQLQHEERRRRMMDERARREGVKSHKEKVEELNKYLSKLSEHHDMPRIGPG